MLKPKRRPVAQLKTTKRHAENAAIDASSSFGFSLETLTTLKSRVTDLQMSLIPKVLSLFQM